MLLKKQQLHYFAPWIELIYNTKSNKKNKLTQRKSHFLSNSVINKNNTVGFLHFQYQISLIIFPQIVSKAMLATKFSILVENLTRLFFNFESCMNKQCPVLIRPNVLHWHWQVWFEFAVSVEISALITTWHTWILNKLPVNSKWTKFSIVHFIPQWFEWITDWWSKC